MLKREALRFVSHLHRGRKTMALYKDLFCSGFSGMAQIGRMSDRSSQIPRRGWIDVGGVYSVNHCSGIDGLSLKCCASESFDGVIGKFDSDLWKPRAVASHHQLIRDSESGTGGEEFGQKIVNGKSRHGSPLRFLDSPMPKKLVVAVDVDEVLGSFLAALNKFIAEHYSLSHSVSEYHVYEFCKIWNCSRIEADLRVHEFFKTAYFKNGIYPIPGAQQSLHKLARFCDLSVVTSRQNAIKDHTIEWIERHYPGLFQEIHFGNHFALDGQSRAKSDICRSFGAQVLIDDNPRYAIECAEVGIKVLLFDYHNSYPWCKTGSATSHPLVTKVHNWQEVEQYLVSWVVS